MPNKIRWGVLGAAKIALVKVIPGMQQCEHAEITAIASRDEGKARAAARQLNIPKHYGSYEALLQDPEIDAIYNPLPNNLHVPWSIKAAEAGKHVLCEKPIALTVEETRQLIAARDRTGVKMGEAFMVHVHPQWLRTLEIVRSGEIGALRAMNCVFCYNNRDPHNIRNMPEAGGGALMDIGCYPIHCSRWIFGEETTRVSGFIERDPVFGTDRLISALLDFPSGHAAFTCSTQLAPYQRMIFFGDQGRIEIEIPVNAPPDQATRIQIHTVSTSLSPAGARTETFPVCDQYTLQGDAFSKAIQGLCDVPVPLEDALANMVVIERLLLSHKL